MRIPIRFIAYFMAIALSCALSVSYVAGQDPDDQDPQSGQVAPPDPNQDPQSGQVAPPDPNQDPQSGQVAPPDVHQQKSKRQSEPVVVVTELETGLIVGEEPLRVTYRVLFLRGVRLDEATFRQAMAPFTVTSIAVGKRSAVPNIKDAEMVPITYTMHLAASLAHGKYRVPPLKVGFTYDEVTIEQKVIRQGSAVSHPMNVEKVPIAVDVGSDHDIGFIGDRRKIFITIRAESSVLLMNEFMPTTPAKGIEYLSAFKPQSPFVLLEQSRTESLQSTYYVVAWTYTLAAYDIKNEPYTVPVPPVVWTTRAAAKSTAPVLGISDPGTGDARTIAPEPVQLLVRSILRDKTDFKPLKEGRADPEWEHRVYAVAPRALFWAICGGLGLWGFAAAVYAMKNRKRRTRIPQGRDPHADSEPPEPIFESGLITRWRLAWQVAKAVKRYNLNPSPEGARTLRELVARCAVTGLKGDRRVDRIEACALTAEEIEAKTGKTVYSALLKALDGQLETGEFRSCT